MRTPINLWLWRYKNPKKHQQGYHLRADAAACQALIHKLQLPEFSKVSYALRPVPENMPLILSTKDPRFIGFTAWRIHYDPTSIDPAVCLEADFTLDMHLNGDGIQTLVEGLGYMGVGQWDFTLGEISYWGLFEDEKERQRRP